LRIRSRANKTKNTKAEQNVRDSHSGELEMKFQKRAKKHSWILLACFADFLRELCGAGFFGEHQLPV
jgi:hypothetical protein